jgi:hypothetical protein
MDRLSRPATDPACRRRRRPRRARTPRSSWELDLSAARALQFLQAEGSDVHVRLPPSLRELRVWRGAAPGQLRTLSGWRWRSPQLPALEELAIGGVTSGVAGDDDEGSTDDEPPAGGWGGAAGGGGGGGWWPPAGGGSAAQGAGAGAGAAGHRGDSGAPAAAAAPPPPALPAGYWDGEFGGASLARALSAAARHAPGLRALALRAGLLMLETVQPHHLEGFKSLEELHLNCELLLLPAGRRVDLTCLPRLRRLTVGRLHAACKVDAAAFTLPPGAAAALCRQPSAAQLLWRVNPCRPRNATPFPSHSGALFPPPPPLADPAAVAAATAAPPNAAAAAAAVLAAARYPGGPDDGGCGAAAAGYAASDAGSLDIGEPLPSHEPWYGQDPLPGQLFPGNFERYVTAMGWPLLCGCYGSCMPRRILFQLQPWHPCEVAECGERAGACAWAARGLSTSGAQETEQPGACWRQVAQHAAAFTHAPRRSAPAPAPSPAPQSSAPRAVPPW